VLTLQLPYLPVQSHTSPQSVVAKVQIRQAFLSTSVFPFQHSNGQDGIPAGIDGIPTGTDGIPVGTEGIPTGIEGVSR
jgi:hypothetical protein